ncbi:RTA1-domain-containing protein [Lentithecium fluviatile CBS 122367]|uniref:RTA1-domain-containing protein n=1 Tax=Lentithecium fluviatile CBS 122367 TaxID=1168545 RepID=A0A6G1JFU9_9PLEO|nr:RTA1-domain-containing protein [Lentithecium fluviatile CBS 122367]
MATIFPKLAEGDIQRSAYQIRSQRHNYHYGDSPYIYEPTLWLVAVATVVFSLVTGAHIWFFVRGRTWFFWAMLVGALMEVAGFISRTISSSDWSNVYAFLGQYLALVLAPSFVAAACYVVFGRIVWWVTPTERRNFRTLWCPPRYVSLFFIAFDIGSFCIQFMGASAAASAVTDDKLSEEERREKSERGRSIMRVGLVLQLLCFMLFAVIGTRFIIISRRWAGTPPRYGRPYVRWERLNWAVNAAATLILIRTVYRMFEFSKVDGASNYVLANEWLFWVLEGLPMLIALILLVVFHPHFYLPEEMRSFRLDRRRLINMEKSSPPSYNLSERTEVRGNLV